MRYLSLCGTSTIVLKKNLSGFTGEGKEVESIDDNNSSEQISNAIEMILSDFERYSIACRHRFENSFYYRKYNEEMRIIVGE